MDEPTNDLDIETLELLESILIDYTGTLLLISHDRAFINQVVSSVLVYEENGHIAEFVGGYDDYLNFKKQNTTKEAPLKVQIPQPKISSSDKLSSLEQKELKQLPARIEKLEAKLKAMQLEMANPTFYQQEQTILAQFNITHSKDELALAELYSRWEYLEEKKSK